ncbi:MAG: hypothetical protein GY928_01140 [Colwellia sp.]|nr:hypothetical protein [Colwellia sp.]
MVTFNKLPFEDIKTSDFGKEVTIRVNAESIKHYTRKLKIFKIIESMGLSEDDETAYNVAAGLMSICTDPKTDKYSFAVEQLTDFATKISIELFNKLSLANLKVNPSNFADIDDRVKTLTTKKKST